MARLIDADALRTNINNVPMHGDHRVFYDIMSELVSVVAAAPTIDTVRHARWVGKYKSTCSWCGDVNVRAFTGPTPMYCQVCGARMDAEEEKDG